MRRIAHEGDPAEGPAIDRILVDHRVFEDLVGVRDQLGHVEPLEAPVLVDVQEIVELAGLVPVVLLHVRHAALGHPVDELVAVLVDVVDDRVDHDLAGFDRADAHVTAPGQDRLASRHTAPGVDAGEHDVFVRIELSAHGRIDAVTRHRDVRAYRRKRCAARGVTEGERYALVVLGHAEALAVGQDAIGAETLQRNLVENAMQLAAVDAQLWIGVAGELPARLLVDHLPVAVGEYAFAILDCHGAQLVLETERAKLAHRVRKQRDAHAQFRDLRGALVHATGEAALMQCQCEREAGDAATDDSDFHDRSPVCCFNRAPCGGTLYTTSCEVGTVASQARASEPKCTDFPCRESISRSRTSRDGAVMARATRHRRRLHAHTTAA